VYQAQAQRREEDSQESPQPPEGEPMTALRRPLLVGFIVTMLTLAGGVIPALAEVASTPQAPGWAVTAHTLPTYLPPGGVGFVEVRVVNVGAASSNGSVTVTDILPPGVTASEAGALASAGFNGKPHFTPEVWDCTGNAPGESPRTVEKFQAATVVTCTNNPEHLPKILAGGTATRGGELFTVAGETVRADPELAIAVRAPASEGAIAEPNRVTVVGGGALGSASTSEPVTVSATPPPFGFAGTDAWFTNEDGTIDTQAGSHPYEFGFTFDLNSVGGETIDSAGRELRNLTLNLPPGFVGDPTAVHECLRAQFVTEERCPIDTQVGVISNAILNDSLFGGAQGAGVVPVFNLVPPPGEPAQFGFSINGNETLIGTSVRSGSDYGITSVTNNVTRTEVVSSILSLWGNPSAPSHDPWRCEPKGANNVCGISLPPSRKPFLTLPTSCEGPQAFSLSGTSWEEPGAEPIRAGFLSHDSNHEPVGFTGCEQLAFGPTITTSPDTSFADTPAGLTVEVKPPLGGLQDSEGLSTADLKNTTVTLPEGLVINPGQAAGLLACQASQTRVGDGADDPPACPLASKVGGVEIETPLLPHSLKGDVYIVQSNPPNLELLVTASGEGINLKILGKVHLDETTGRLTSTFSGTPALPFTNFKLAFSGGAQAALDTPTQCRTYTTAANFGPWSSPFGADFLTNADFNITEGPGGGACSPNPLPFAPTLTAGSTTDQAGGFTDFSLLLQRGDGQQRIERLQFRAPAGLSAMLSQVSLCPEPQAALGTCPAGSHIGHAVVASGPGPYPLVLPQPGAPELAIYLTGPYRGAPFGLSIVTPVIAGPFDLGTIVTRAKIEVDPTTAQITVTTDPLPQVVKGVPTDLRQVQSVIDRPGFMFNPTNCNPQAFSGTAWGTPPPGAGGPGAAAAISSHFGVGSCRSLEFHPKFSVSTPARTSKATGAGLTAKVAYPKAPQGTQSEITKVKVELPKQLPSQLKTLQKACLAAVFEANPAACPPESIVGHAIVHTQLLPVPLTGPAYFVSHGGEAFPSLTIVLQGYGVTIDLVGATFISKAGITSTTFKTVPDVPFETFELTLPQGKYAALGANLPPKAHSSFCGQNLKMPTLFQAQNGLETRQNTPITITGCPKAHKTTKKHKKHGKARHARRGANKKH
jgi:hypothetical protein